MIDTPLPDTDRGINARGPTDREATGSTVSSVADLLSGILDDAQTLIRQQAAMLRAEIREDALRTLSVLEYLSVGAVLAAVGGLFLMISLVYLLNYFVPTLPLWACWAILGGIDLAGGAVAIVVGRKLYATYNPLPDKTLNAIEENLTWKTTTPRK